MATAHIHKFVGVQHKKKTFERCHCIPNMRLGYSDILAYLEITKAAISLYASNILHNLVSDSDLQVRKCLYPPHKNRRPKVEREVNLEMGEEIKAGGELITRMY